MKHFHFHVNVHCTIPNLSLSCPCIQRKEFSFTITNANVYVNLFLFHLRSEILIIEGYYTKYPNPTISFYYYITISNLSLSCLTFKEFSFAFAKLILISPLIRIRSLGVNNWWYYTEYPNPTPTISFSILRKVILFSLSYSLLLPLPFFLVFIDWTIL